MKRVLGNLVNINQSAFVAGRQIQDNILLTQELLKGYDRKRGPSRVAFKIDIQKAYDTVNWCFLETILTHFGFHGKMIQWIMVYVKTTSFTINVNGELCGFFKGGKGLRQGDPLSPYLFTLFMECFTLMMERNVQRNPKFQYHFGCKGIKLTHVCFADDLLVLCHGDAESVKVVRDTIEEFGKCSGLLPNFHKRVPLITKRLGIKNCKCLVDKVRSRISNWKNKFLSCAGRLQLIASILESIQVNWCTVFLLPKTVIKEINSLLMGFLWCNGKLSRGKAKIAWKKICKPKSHGGLGLKDLEIWNKALLISIDPNDSWGWKNLMEIRNEIRKHVWCKLGDGMTTSTWYDNWCEGSPLCRIISNKSIYSVGLSRDMMVADIVVDGNWTWPTEWLNEFSILRQIRTLDLKTEKKDWLV
nr:hypothetical protein [Tanacetum cinerariifolium]